MVTVASDPSHGECTERHSQSGSTRHKGEEEWKYTAGGSYKVDSVDSLSEKEKE